MEGMAIETRSKGGNGIMKIEKRELAIVGGGPAGLAAAIEAAKAGVQVLLIDENERPGGQLFKQIHKLDRKPTVQGFGEWILVRSCWKRQRKLMLRYGWAAWFPESMKEILFLLYEIRRVERNFALCKRKRYLFAVEVLKMQ